MLCIERNLRTENSSSGQFFGHPRKNMFVIVLVFDVHQAISTISIGLPEKIDRLLNIYIKYLEFH
jgi:hypothetical protein